MALAAGQALGAGEAALAGLAALAVGAGQVTRGATLLGAMAALLGRTRAALDRDDRRSAERTGESAGALLGETAFERVRQAGAALGSARIAAYALAGATSRGRQP